MGFRRSAAGAASGTNLFTNPFTLGRPAAVAAPGMTVDGRPLASSLGSAQRRIADGTGGTVFRDGYRGVSKGAELALQVQGGEGERLVGVIGVECSRHASGVRDPPESLSPLFDDEYVGDRRRARR